MALENAINQSCEVPEDLEDDSEFAEGLQNTFQLVCGLFVLVIYLQVYLPYQTIRVFLVQSDSKTQSGTVIWDSSINLQNSNHYIVELAHLYGGWRWISPRNQICLRNTLCRAG